MESRKLARIPVKDNMSAGKPFKSIEEKARQLGWSQQELYEWLKDQGYSDKDIEDAFSPDALTRIVFPSVERLLPKAAFILKWDVQKLKSKFEIEVANSERISCSTVQGRQFMHMTVRRHRLRVDAGFLFFVNKLSLVFANELLKGEEPVLPDAIREAARLLHAFYGKHSKSTAWSVSPRAVTSRQALTAAVLSGTLRDAAVAHEFGHIISDLAGQDFAPHKQIQELIPLLSAQSGLAGRWPSQWTSEMVADFVAGTLLEKPSTKGQYASLDALAILMSIIDMIETADAGAGQLGRTHPPAKVRFGFLVQIFPGFAYSRMFEQCHFVCRAISAEGAS